MPEEIPLEQLKATEAKGDTCALENGDYTQLCTYPPLHNGRHSWQVPEDVDDGGQAASAYRALHEEGDGELLKRLGTDASEWAREFLTRFEANKPDLADMLGWFANAIGAGESVGHNRAMSQIHDAARELGVDLTEVYTIPHAVNVVHGHWQATFADATALNNYLNELNDAGVEPQVPILDSNKIVWLTYGEEHSSGGEVSQHWLLQGDPEDQIQEVEVKDDKDFVVDYHQAYQPVPLTEAAYPVRLLHRPHLP